MSNSNVKKAYVELIELLRANENKKVSTILPQILEMVTSKGGVGKTFMKDDEGNVIAIYCYYHKKWEPISECEYGQKASTAHGFNTMCKEGVSNWTKQQRKAKIANEKLLDDVANGDVEVGLIGDIKQTIDDERKAIIPREDGVGFDSELELI
ncbi:MAG: hypothetical protein ACR2PH_17925 [Desulfobulbia bacterium]